MSFVVRDALANREPGFAMRDASLPRREVQATPSMSQPSLQGVNSISKLKMSYSDMVPAVVPCHSPRRFGSKAEACPFLLPSGGVEREKAKLVMLCSWSPGLERN